MQTVNSHMTVQDFLSALDRHDIVINRDYQRSDQVWPVSAQSYLVETVLLNFPIPKIAIHQIVDVTTGVAKKELIDGQQRIGALRTFYQGDYSLSSSVETADLRGLSFHDLDTDRKIQFLNYVLSVDLFLGAEDWEIREVFRRMNSYTAPLNPEEQRHAKYQGAMKWALNDLAKSLSVAWQDNGIFTKKALVRMRDVKLLAELCHAMLYGITTTTKTSLDRLYKDNDGSFPYRKEFEGHTRFALSYYNELEEIHATLLAKPFQAYSLLLALAHVNDPLPQLTAHFPAPARRPLNRRQVVDRLMELATALEDSVQRGPFAAFVKASEASTNVGSQRATRFRYFCEALVG